MAFAETYVAPIEGELGAPFWRQNDLGERFCVRPGRIRAVVAWGAAMNVKVVLSIQRTDGLIERLLVDTDAYDIEWNRHRRVTREFCLCPRPLDLAPIVSVRCAFVVHHHGRSLTSEFEYAYLDDLALESPSPLRRALGPVTGPNTYRTFEVEAGILQRDIDWYNRHFESLRLVPKFTHGNVHHPYHPKRYIHDRIDHVIRLRQQDASATPAIKVCVDCIDDADFVTHLLHAHSCGVRIQCVVDWRKMTLTHSVNYRRLKQSGIELLGVFCSSCDPVVEVAPDMHMKFILFGEEDALHGSFNITFDRWGWNWETGMSFKSHGVARLLDNIFQSVRGGVIQPYRIEPLSHFNLLYTFGGQVLDNGRLYRPHHAILSEINRARHSIRLCIFLLGEMRGEHDDSVVDALIQAARRRVDVSIIANGHIARQGDPGREYSMAEELQRPLVPALARLRAAGVRVDLAYGRHCQRIPYCPLHAKYCIIDDRLVLDGSFNWYNTSVHSHDLLIVAANEGVVRAYTWEFEQTRAQLYYPAA